METQAERALGAANQSRLIPFVQVVAIATSAVQLLLGACGLLGLAGMFESNVIPTALGMGVPAGLFVCQLIAARAALRLRVSPQHCARVLAAWYVAGLSVVALMVVGGYYDWPGDMRGLLIQSGAFPGNELGSVFDLAAIAVIYVFIPGASGLAGIVPLVLLALAFLVPTSRRELTGAAR